MQKKLLIQCVFKIIYKRRQRYLRCRERKLLFQHVLIGKWLNGGCNTSESFILTGVIETQIDESGCLKWAFSSLHVTSDIQLRQIYINLNCGMNCKKVSRFQISMTGWMESIAGFNENYLFQGNIVMVMHNDTFLLKLGRISISSHWFRRDHSGGVRQEGLWEAVAAPEAGTPWCAEQPVMLKNGLMEEKIWIYVQYC